MLLRLYGHFSKMEMTHNKGIPIKHMGFISYINTRTTIITKITIEMAMLLFSNIFSYKLMMSCLGVSVCACVSVSPDVLNQAVICIQIGVDITPLTITQTSSFLITYHQHVHPAS